MNEKYQRQKVLLVDAFGLLFRSYYSLEKTGLKDAAGNFVFAVYGFWKNLQSVLKTYPVDEILIALDGGSTTYRHKEWTSYKQNRKKPPGNLISQIILLNKMLEDTHFPYAMNKTLEADDIIASAVFYLKQNQREVYIYSSDKDLAQLVDDNVKILKPTKDGIQCVENDSVAAHFKVPSNQIRDYLALVGDSSDNIPGVKGIGEKTAIQLLDRYASLDEIYEHLLHFDTKIQNKLLAGKEYAYLSYRLVDLQKPYHLIEWKEEDFIISARSYEKLLECFHTLSFRFKEVDLMVYQKMLKDSIKNITDFSSIKGENILITDLESWQALFHILLNKETWAFDLETTGLNPLTDEIVAIAFSYQEKQSYVVPSYLLTSTAVQKDLITLFTTHHILKIAHHMKYDLSFIEVFLKICIVSPFFDTMIAAYLLDSNSKQYSLDFLVKERWGYQKRSYQDLIQGVSSIQEVPLEQLVSYAGEDVDFTYRLYHVLKDKLVEFGLMERMETIEMPLIPVLSQMERIGIAIDISCLNQLKEKLNQYIKEVQNHIYDFVGQEFNLNSPKILNEILFHKLQIPTRGLKKTSLGYSTDEKNLKKMIHFPIIQELLKYRQYTKLLNTYVQQLPQYLAQDGRIHSQFHQTTTATGRLSSSHPNLQNIPIREELGKEIRKAFIPAKGYMFLGLDYSQIELRLLAHFSGDEKLINFFNQDLDVHAYTASYLFGIDPQQISQQQRNLAKTINFGVIYGMGPWKLSQETGMSLNSAREFIDQYFQLFEGVSQFIHKTKLEAEQDSFVETLLGHKRFLPEIMNINHHKKTSEERVAVNAIIQGSNADLMKLVMIEISKQTIEGHLLLQIHDELIFEIKEEFINSVQNHIQNLMENIIELKVPLKTNRAVGKNWGELK